MCWGRMGELIIWPTICCGKGGTVCLPQTDPPPHQHLQLLVGHVTAEVISLSTIVVLHENTKKQTSACLKDTAEERFSVRNQYFNCLTAKKKPLINNHSSANNSSSMGLLSRQFQMSVSIQNPVERFVIL